VNSVFTPYSVAWYRRQETSLFPDDIPYKTIENKHLYEETGCDRKSTKMSKTSKAVFVSRPLTAILPGRVTQEFVDFSGEWLMLGACIGRRVSMMERHYEP
jgi:hypothetical protein